MQDEAYLRGDMKFFLSPYSDVFENLCLEDYFLRSSTEELVLFYINGPCVVMGNFQNPWMETNLAKLKELGVKLARRQSGGGTVFHDVGNLNFCIFKNKNILSKKDKQSNRDFLCATLKQKGIKIVSLEKSGMAYILKGEPYKFSGEAFKQTSKRSFHHGTLLINSDLKKLNASIRPELENIKTKAVSSNPHKVGNLNQVYRGLTTKTYVEGLISKFGLIKLELDESKLSSIREAAKELSKDELIYGKTPSFEVVINGKKVLVKNAQVCKIDGVGIEPKYFSVDDF